MAHQPRFSIITPSYNQGAYIEQTICSVLEQNYPALEYIIIDGGSTDGTIEIIKKFARWLTYWVSEPDRGQAHALNKGLQRATGQIIGYLNSDDYYLENALMRVAECVNVFPDADILYGRCRRVDERGHKIGETVSSISSYEEVLDLWDVWYQGRNFVQPEVFWTKRIMDRIGRFREDLFWVMDYDYWLRIFAAGGRVGFVDAELAALRHHPAQKSNQPNGAGDEILEVVRPYIFAEGAAVSWSKRIDLRAKWNFEAIFLRTVDESLRANEERWQRWLRLVGVAIRHPFIIVTHGFRERFLSVLGIAGSRLRACQKD
jgi:glycosyltransferase involved in cell wall biosynthesis